MNILMKSKLASRECDIIVSAYEMKVEKRFLFDFDKIKHSLLLMVYNNGV